MRFRCSQAGFKIVEITIVLALIGFIAAIIFPVFQKVRSGSHRSCQSMMKQLGLAYIQYQQDADEKMPPGVNAAGNGWAGEIYSYTKSTGLYHCPNDEQDGSFVSYAENQNLVKQNTGDFAAPAATVELYEFTTLNCNPSTSETTSATGLAAPQNSARHDPDTFGLNFLTVDGHVRNLMPIQVSNGPQAVSAKRLPQGFYRETFAIK